MLLLSQSQPLNRSIPALIPVMPPYKYLPLGKNQIRLFELHEASSRKGDLQGTIHVMTLPEERELGYDQGIPSPAATENDTTPTISVEYTALSHHWGPRGGRSSIKIITNDLTPHEIPIRDNLEPALRTMRAKIVPADPSTRFYWIDAICIDQADPEDKDKQIPMMAHIYNGAKLVCVWLGDAFDGSGEGLGFVDKLKELDGLTKLLKDENTTAEWDAFSKLARRPWFSRRWIVQEITVARHAILHCGDKWVTWDDFANAMSLFASLKEEIRKLFKSRPEFHHNPDQLGDIMESGANKLVQAKSAIFRTKHNKQISEHLLSLEGLISILTVFDVEDPMDLVYSILWLSRDARPGPKRRAAARNNRFVAPTPNQSPIQSREGSPVTLSPDSWAVVPIDHHSFDQFHEDDSDLDETLDAEEGQRRPAGPSLMVPGTVRQTEREHSPTRAQIAINYKQPVFNLCREVLRFIVRTSNRLDMMCFPWAPEPRLEDHRLKYRDEKSAAKAEDSFVPERQHPSWICPRKNAPFGLNKLGQYRRILADPLVGTPGVGQRTYLACGKTRPEVKFDGRKLIVGGFEFDRIHKIELPASGGNIPPAWLSMAMWSSSTRYPPERFWRTLVADKGTDGKDPPAHYSLACQWAFDQRTTGDNLYPSQLLTHVDCNPVAEHFLRRVQAVVWQRSLFMIKGVKDDLGKLSDGFLGLAPSAARVGDRVCILKGCSVPVVLRPVKKRQSAQFDRERGRSVRQKMNDSPRETDSPQDVPTIRVTGDGNESTDEAESSVNEAPAAFDGDEEYKFIGDCYVHGIMDGEAFQYMEDRGRTERRFVLI